jgi:tripartite-type tricarboxylate transporter receptor subunit TctC
MRLQHGLLLAMLALPIAAHAQSSQNPIQIIVPFAPGGSADGIGRITAVELGARLGRPTFVESKPGAGGSLGLTVLAKSPPDGDTLAIAATGVLVINAHVPVRMDSIPYASSLRSPS